MYIIGEVKLHTVHLLGELVTCYMRSRDACEIVATAFLCCPSLTFVRPAARVVYLQIYRF